MKENKPLKRSAALRPLSIDHHQGLLLCWKIRTGIKKRIDPERISSYVGWFYKNHLLPHFEIEELHVFPVLGMDHELVKRAMGEHRIMRTLLPPISTNEKLAQAAEVLESHIRFEERRLFEQIQLVATLKELEQIQAVHQGLAFYENDTDRFWERES